MHFSLQRWFAGGLLMVVTSGCGIEADSIASLQSVSLRKHQLSENLDVPSMAGEATRPASSTFVPPFPERRNPFEKSELESQSAPAQATTANVQVMGFAKLKEQQAILRIGDQTRFVVERDRIDDIEVLSIRPPRVKLKNGNLIWETSMFHTPAKRP